MGIKKADLYKFVEYKIEARLAPIRKAIAAALKAEFYPVIASKYPEADALERSAQRFHDELQLLIGKHPRFNKWKWTNIARDVNSDVIGLRADLASTQARLASSNILDNGTDRLIDELDALVPAFKAKHLVEITEYKQICKLCAELLPIIDGCRTGDKAYAKLQELGVDLTGFDTGTPNLPAVIKLTVDVKLLNG